MSKFKNLNIAKTATKWGQTGSKSGSKIKLIPHYTTFITYNYLKISISLVHEQSIRKTFMERTLRDIIGRNLVNYLLYFPHGSWKLGNY